MTDDDSPALTRDRELDIDWSKLQIADDPTPPEPGFRFRSWVRSMSSRGDAERSATETEPPADVDGKP